MATSTEFQSFLNLSLSAISSGNWKNIDFEQFEFSKKQSETVTQLKSLVEQFDNMIDQKESEHLQDLLEQKTQTLISSALDPIITITAKGIIESVNPAFTKMFLYEPEEVVGQNIKMLMPEPYHSEHDGYLDNYKRTGDKQIIGKGREVIALRKDGSTFPIHLSVSEYLVGTEKLFTGIVRDLSAQKEAERLQATSEQKTRAMIISALDPIITIAAKGIIESVNPAFTKMFLYEPEEVVGKNIKMLMPEPYHSEHDEYLDNYKRTGNKKIIGKGREVTALRKDGSTFPIHLSVSEYLIGDTKLFTGIVRDLTAQKEAERLLEVSEQKSRAMISSALDPIITIAAKGIIESVNQAFTKMFLYEPEEVVGKNIKILMPEPYHSEHDGYLDNYKRTGDKQIIGKGREVTALRKDGSTFPIHLSVSEYLIGDNKLFTGIVRDLTAQKEAERLLEVSEQKSRAMISSALDPIITITGKGIIESVNPAFTKMFLYQPGEVVGQNIKMLMPEPYHSEHDGYLDNFKRTGNKKIIGKGREVTALRKDGSTFPIHLSVSEYLIGNNKLFTGIVRDLTEIKDNEAYLEELVEVADTLSKGDYSKFIRPKNEHDRLGIALQNMTKILKNISEVADGISQGDTSLEVPEQSEKDLLAKSINQMIYKFDQATRQANEIAKGNYSIDIKPKSERDLLGKSLLLMTKNIREVMNKSQREDWIKTGQAELANAMRGEKSVDELADQVISYIAKYTGAHVGVFYLADKARNLSLAGSYAYQRRKNLSNKISVGEGIVGQSVKEKQAIIISDVPDDYISVNSGLGQAAPNNLMVSPLLLEGSVKGAIEIGRFGEFDDKAIELLERSNESIAMAINSAHDRVRMQDLLEEAQRSSEELQAQQEELRASNEELEEQTKTISMSEASLKSQQKALQASNTELEEKTESLQRQKQEISDKNIKIEGAKKQLEDKAQELEVSSKYKSEFLANMSHELRTPLNSLLILSELLAKNKEGNLTDKQLESAAIIHRGGQDLLSLINDILDLSKVESGKLTLEIQNIELDKLESSICTQFKPLTQNKEFEFISELAADLPKTIQTDQMRTLQVLKNLMSNAFKFTLQGSVVFRIFVPDRDVVFKQEHLNSQNCIGFSVTDTGIGIEQDKQRLIFEAFQQADGSTNRKFGGTGLGLTISKELCRLLGGELQIFSEYQKGSTFSVYLPLLNDGEHGNRGTNLDHFSLAAVISDSSSTSTDNLHQDREKTITPLSLPAVETTGYIMPLFIDDDRNVIKPSDKTVLIIEDDKDFSSVLIGISKDKDYKVLVAGDGKSALHLAAKYLPSAIILDLGLPDIDGIKVLALFKSDLTTRHIPVYVISGREELENAMNHGAIGVLKKPTSAVELNKVFIVFDEILSGQPKKLMIIDDDQDHCHSIKLLLENDGIEITEAYSAEQAMDLMKKVQFDCVVLDLHLPGITGRELLLKMHESRTDKSPAVVINTGSELTEEEYAELNRYTNKIIRKGSVSNERLLDEVMLFLHQTPLSLPDSQRQAIQMLHSDESFFDGRTVLLVDDDLRNTFALSTVLEEKGLNVIIAENGLRALEALGEHDNIEVVLMDIMMPVMDGYEAMKEIRGQVKYHGLPIIALTAKAMAEDKAKCLEAGATDYLNKPVKMEELFALLKVSLS